MNTHILKRVSLFILLLSTLASCKGQQEEKASNKKEQLGLMPNKEVTLVKTIPGGSRAHIITLSKTGVLSYNVGSLSNLDEFSLNNVIINGDFKGIETNLREDDIELVNNLILKNKQPYKDSVVVKDNMQYYLYFDGVKKAFGYEKNTESYPDELKKLISFLLEKIGSLHKITGMS